MNKTVFLSSLLSQYSFLHRTVKSTQAQFCAFACLLSSLVALSGCGLSVSENRPVLVALDNTAKDTWMTESPGKFIMLPVSIPAGTAALVVDGATTLPYKAVKKAGCDTYESLWENPPQGSEFRQTILFFPKVVASAVMFSSDFLFSYAATTHFKDCGGAK